MNRTMIALLNVVFMSLVGIGLFPTTAAALTTQDEAQATQDVLYFHDGRILTGRIISETEKELVFEFESHSIKSKMTFSMDLIMKIDRGVAKVTDSSKPASRKPRRSATSQPSNGPAALVKRSGSKWGRHMADPDDESATSFYIVSMQGQMGTDINSEVYREVVDEIKQLHPDIVVIKMLCEDVDDHLYNRRDREDMGMVDYDDYRDLINMFSDELRGVRQIMWVHQAVGTSSTIAMAWPEIYMIPEGRLGGMISAKMQTGFDGWADADVRGKMTAAFMGWLKGFLLVGGYQTDLAYAMVIPKYKLSGSWKGREVDWSLDTKGEYVIDNSDKTTTDFTAKTAEDFNISKGTAEDIYELAFLLGHREFRVLETSGESGPDKYREDWRRLFEQTEKWREDADQFMGWASGDDELKYLGQVKGRLERVMSAMDRYKAVETRWGRRGLTRMNLLIQIEQLKERIIAIKNSRRGGRGGRGGGRAPGAGGGGGRPNPGGR